MERLSSLDGVFLAIEDRHTPMNIGSVALFDGPTPALADILDVLAPRLASVARCRQRIKEPMGPFGRPVWIDDARFDVRHHLEATSVAERGCQDFDELVAVLLATPLDRRRPLWRLYVVDDVAPNRWAVVAMVHHSLADGVAGNDLLTALLTGESGPVPAFPNQWQPAPEPSAFALLTFHVSQSLHGGLSLLRGAARAVSHPFRSGKRAFRTMGAAKRLWYRQRHVPTSLVGPIGSKRRWTSLSIPMSEVRTIQAALDCTVNDVLVAAVTSGFRALLISRGEVVAGRSITAMVPVSLRTPDERGSTGNRVANVHARLPMDDIDPMSLLRHVHAHLDELKFSHEVDATGFLMNIGNYVPRFLADRVARSVVQRQRNVETVITNVPGPRSTLQLGTHRMNECYPVAPIAGLVRLTVAVWSYNDNLAIGITGDRETVPDIDVLVDGIRRGLDDLRRALGESLAR